MKKDREPLILDAAARLFKTRGYHPVLMADIATESKVPLPAVLTHFNDKSEVLEALLERASPREELRRVLAELKYDTLEDMTRGVIVKLMDVLNSHTAFMDMAILDLQVNNGTYMAALFSELAGDAASFINRMSNMPGARPISVIMLGRAFASLLIGFAVTQHLAPRPAQFAMRIFPQKAWVEGIADIFLYGIMEQAD